ncbi:MAG: hypothetical protein HQ574_03290 [Chloroflexi bacterium]|nr:hypothetical protein [Chloroflexota bacterium]
MNTIKFLSLFQLSPYFRAALGEILMMMVYMAVCLITLVVGLWKRKNDDPV